MCLKAVHAPLLATTAEGIAYPLERIISEYLVSRGCSVVASILHTIHEVVTRCIIVIRYSSEYISDNIVMSLVYTKLQ